MIRIETQGMKVEELARVAREISVGIIPDATRNAINRALIATRTAASKHIREEYNVAAGEIRATFWLRRASKTKLEGLAISRGTRIPLSRFSARQTKRGATVNVKKSTGRRTLSRSFFGQGSLPSSRLFRRTKEPKRAPSKGTYAGKMKRDGTPLLREPIQQLFGPSIPHMLATIGVQQQVLARAEEMYLNTLEHELRRRIDKRLAEARNVAA
jgi:hypothetical protein